MSGPSRPNTGDQPRTLARDGAHVRDAAYHVADDVAAIERYGEREAGLLGDLANELADVLDALGRVGDAREARRTRSAHDVPLRHIPHGVRVKGVGFAIDVTYQLPRVEKVQASEATPVAPAVTLTSR